MYSYTLQSKGRGAQAANEILSPVVRIVELIKWHVHCLGSLATATDYVQAGLKF